MPKPNKRSIKFLRKAAKSDQGVKKMGRKRQRKEEPDMTEVEVDNVLPMHELKSSEPVKKKNSLKRHQEELDSLKEKDPEFFEYLSKNDSGLLEFDDGEEDDDEELSDDEIDEQSSGSEEEDSEGEDDDDGEDEEGATGSKPAKYKPLIEATQEVVDTVVKASLKGSLTSLKKMMSMFRATCLPSNGKDEDEGDGKPTSRFLVNNPAVYEYAMTEILDKAHRCFYSQLGLSPGKISSDLLESLGSHPKWKKLQFYVLSFYKSILHTLASLSTQISTEGDDSSSGGPHVAAFIVSCLEPYIPLLSPLPRLAKGVLKVLLRLWSTGPAPEEDSSNLRGHSFLRIRQMSIALPGAVAEECFRSMYLSYARTAKAFNEQTSSSVVFMAQCVTELYQTDVAQAYQQAFLYIRQLALHLRTAVLKKTPEATKQVLTWQYLNCLRLWTRLICSMPEEEDLGPLVFPLSQILYGVITASPSSVYVPLHFHVISCLQQLAAHSKTFIPTASLLTSVLESHDIQSNSLTPSTDAPPKLQHIVRLPAGSLTKAPVREAVVQVTVNLLRYDAEIYRFHVGIPEYAYPTTRKLKAFVKKSKVSRWRDMCRALSNQYEQFATIAVAKRVQLGVSPMDVTGFEPLIALCQNDQKTKILPSHERLAKLMSADSGAALTSASSAVVSASAVALPGKGQLRAATAAAEKLSSSAGKKKKRTGDDDDSEEDEDGDSDSSNSDDESVEESESEEGDVEEEALSDMEDQVGAIDWSDDDEN